VTVNKPLFSYNKKFPNAALNPIAALNLERLLSARLCYFEDPLRFSTLVFFSILLPKLDRKFDLTAFLTNIMSQLFEILTDCSAKLHKNVSTKYNYCVDWQHPNCDDNSK
jgi:hypothetical protein